MVRIEKEDISYKELLVIDSDAEQHTCACLGISQEGELLFIKETEARSCNAYYMKKAFFRIDKEEYFSCLGIAAKNLRLQRAISKGAAELELSYKGRYFHAGSSIRYIIHHKECSIFTAEDSLAEELDFRRIDKFEYEKNLPIQEWDAVRITHKDAESEAVLFRMEIESVEIEKWLDRLCHDAKPEAVGEENEKMESHWRSFLCSGILLCHGDSPSHTEYR